MLKDNRRQKIVELVNQNGSIKTSELTKLFKTTRQTIHNDLDMLTQKGLLKKVYGGAVRTSKSEEPSTEKRKVTYPTEKKHIGYAATQFINEKDTIFLDVSTTVNEMIPFLTSFKDLTIITNSIESAYLLSKHTNFHLIMIGGHVRNKDYATGGISALNELRNIFVDKSFFGAGGISTMAGLTDYHFTDSDIRKVLLKNSSEIYVLFDASKINSVTISKYANLTDIDKLISYDVKDTSFLEYLKENEISFVDAKEISID